VRKICVITGTRAEYGLLRWVMQGIRDSKRLDLQVIATGAHLSPEFGLTFREIEKDGFAIDRKVEMLLSSDTVVGVTKSMALGLSGFADALAALRPDAVVILGDRFEAFSAAAAAMIACIPIAHLHGGETTEGAIDEAIRHAITKMSHMHFVAAEGYRRRVIQLGESPDRVFNVGGLGLDNIRKLRLLDRPALEAALDFKLGTRNLLVTFHPVTLERGSAVHQMQALLTALDALEDTHIVITMPNADTEGRSLMPLIESFVGKRPRTAKSFASLGQLRYLSCIQHMDAVVGNSSSGLTEAPSFRKGTVNIGDRQRGRLKASTVINCEPSEIGISEALERLYSPEFQAGLKTAVNPYGDGGASESIVRTLERIDLKSLLKKSFYDLPELAP